MTTKLSWWRVLCALAVAVPVALSAPTQIAQAVQDGVLCNGSEHEPNDGYQYGGGCVLGEAEPLAARLDPVGDQDWFEFSPTRLDAFYEIQASPGSRVDLALVVRTREGQEIGYSDSGKAGEAEKVGFWAGDFPAVVVGVLPRNGNAGRYVIEAGGPRVSSVTPPPVPPGFTHTPTQQPQGTPVPVPTATLTPGPPTAPPPPPTYPPYPTYPPPYATYPPPPAATSPAPLWLTPPATPLRGEARGLTWYAVAMPLATAVVTIVDVRVYYDLNDNKNFDLGEGVRGLSVYVLAQGELVGWGITGRDGGAEIPVAGGAGYRVAVPFLGWQAQVAAAHTSQLVLRLPAVQLPTFFPVQAGGR